MKRVKGASMIEYVLIAVLISIVATVAITTLGSGVESRFSSIVDSLNSSE